MKTIYFKELDSTNKYAKSEAKKGAAEGTVIIADKQTGGYGRMGRDFCSPEGSGLYMSIILRPKIKPKDCLLITTAAAVAVSQAIESITNIKTGIKWVNDIYVGNKKVCGILTEAGFTCGDTLDYAILGIGVNIYEPKDGFPKDIKEIAGCIFTKPQDKSVRDKLAEEIISCFNKYYAQLDNKEFLPIYKEKNIVVGKDVTIINGNTQYPARVVDIDDELRLVVEDKNNNITALDSGEISIRM